MSTVQMIRNIGGPGFGVRVDSLPPPETEALPIEAVPAGRVDEVLAWVGTDRRRADVAWDAEVAGKRRRTLLVTLAAIADGGEA